MGLFGRTSCREDRSWRVRAYMLGDVDDINLTEQLNEEEATKFFEEVQKEFDKPTKTIKILKDRGEYKDRTYLIVKSGVSYIKLESY